MTEEQYREATERTWNVKSQTMTPEEQELSNIAMGVGGEAGEIVDLLKKVIHHGHSMDIDHLTKELGDLKYYLTRLMMFFGISEEKVMIENVLKLRARYPEGFNSEDSINREL
jgi:NTP pyrophosphatase (non-canonical NTP hydrolase)